MSNICRFLKCFLILFVLILAFSSCQKNEEKLNKEDIQLEYRLDLLDKQTVKINDNIKIVQQQNKISLEESKILLDINTGVNKLISGIRNNYSNMYNYKIQLTDELKMIDQNIGNAISVLSSPDIVNTLKQFTENLKEDKLLNNIMAKDVEYLTQFVTNFGSDIEFIKRGELNPTLDRPIEVIASKGDFGKQITVTWVNMPQATNYQLYRFSAVKNDYELIYEGNSNEFVDKSTVVPYTKVYYKVRIYNNPKSYSPFSDVVYGYLSGKNYSQYLFFGYEGNTPGLLGLILHLSTDQENNIYLSDDYNKWVQKFDSKGVFREIYHNGNSPRGSTFLKNGNAVITTTQTNTYVKIFDKNKNIVKQWGSYGTSDTQFQNIEQITVDDEDNIYLIDGTGNSVKKYDSNGNFLLKFTATIRTAQQTDGPYPMGITFMNGKIFVSSARNGLIRTYDKNGNFVSMWDTGSKYGNDLSSFDGKLYIACDGYIMKTDEKGEVREKIGETELKGRILSGLSVNKNGEVVVSDPYSRKIFVFKQI
ncbi:NHL repeat protein [Sphingobacterium spiritivorum ATCC 33300]|uniref:NHL repeat protein n=1 Tax=Sphingobacterium spiritivorum ATCC 33300 TaxID=525372 RepID=C2G5C0_SPHSI|nr:NHL repeat-containing protein [Sphingobacterium spiritivorum]EEI89629.1 NHL repeat protein [Sphingobacterium spiritivorum ATCC 33300]QQS94625.1 NHL repeat-containing protein [Sphingobacterium spiritivorum]